MLKDTPLTIKEFVRSWNFANPRWNELPTGFPNVDKSQLTKEEQHLIGGIKLAWSADAGRNIFYKQTVRKSAVVAALVFTVIAGGNLIISRQTSTNTVSAKTVSQVVGNAVEATMSAVFRK